AGLPQTTYNIQQLIGVVFKIRWRPKLGHYPKFAVVGTSRRYAIVTVRLWFSGKRASTCSETPAHLRATGRALSRTRLPAGYIAICHRCRGPLSRGFPSSSEPGTAASGPGSCRLHRRLRG